MSSETLTLEKLQRTDHDLLIRLESKVDSLIVDVKEVKDGTNTQLTDHETRIRVVEKVHEEVNPIQTVKEFRELQQQMHDFKTIWKFVITVASVIGGVIGFALSLVTDSLRLFGR